MDNWLRSKFSMPSKNTVLLIIIVVLITLLLSAMIAVLLSRTHNLRVPSLGTIMTEGVEAYWDANLTDKIDANEKIDWGTLQLGSSSNVTIYLLSVSNIETTLKLAEENLVFYQNQTPLQPSSNILTYMNLSWNYKGDILRPGDTIQVTLALKAEYSPDFISYLIENDVESFSLDIHIQTSD